MAYPTELVEKARYEIRVFERVSFDTGKQLVDEAQKLRKALSFYADESRYNGPNIRLQEGDEWSEQVGLLAYKLDVTRDGGHIARAALEDANKE